VSHTNVSAFEMKQMIPLLCCCLAWKHNFHNQQIKKMVCLRCGFMLCGSNQ